MRRLVTGLATLALVGGAAATASAAAPGWRFAQTSGVRGNDVLADVAFSPGGSGWAVGSRDLGGESALPLVQHLVKGKWVTAKTPPASLEALGAVGASSSTNVWVFGNGAARWNGKKWTDTKFPHGDPDVQRPVVLSPSNVWAFATNHTYHWNGKKWGRVAVPKYVTLRGGSAVSAKNIWAIGVRETDKAHQGVVVHYDGHAWKVAKAAPAVPGYPDAGTFLNSVAVSGKNVWAVGARWKTCGDKWCYHPLTMRLTGKKWTSTIDAKGTDQYWNAVPDGSGGIWAVNGTRFVHVTTSKTTRYAMPRNSHIQGMTHRPGTSTSWAVGDNDQPNDRADGVYLRFN